MAESELELTQSLLPEGTYEDGVTYVRRINKQYISVRLFLKLLISLKPVYRRYRDDPMDIIEQLEALRRDLEKIAKEHEVKAVQLENEYSFNRAAKHVISNFMVTQKRDLEGDNLEILVKMCNL